MTSYKNAFLTSDYINKVKFLEAIEGIMAYSDDNIVELKQHVFEYIKFTSEFIDNLYMTDKHKFEPLYILDQIDDLANQMIKCNAYLNENHIKEKYNLNQVRIYVNSVNNVMLAFIAILRDFRGIISYNDPKPSESSPGWQRIEISRLSPVVIK